MCTSGKSSFDVQNVHTACGLDPTLTNIGKEIQIGFKHVANKIGTGATKAVVQIRARETKAANNAKKLFGEATE